MLPTVDCTEVNVVWVETTRQQLLTILPLAYRFVIVRPQKLNAVRLNFPD